jgi:hypothetical protein
MLPQRNGPNGLATTLTTKTVIEIWQPSAAFLKLDLLKKKNCNLWLKR